MPSTFPACVARLFWDVSPESVDLILHRDYVLERVMSRGGREAMAWLRQSYSRDDLASFVLRKGALRLSSRDLAYWSLIAGVKQGCAVPTTRPSWMGP